MFEYPSPLVQSELAFDEILLWAGQPRQGICFRRSDIFLIPFSLLWGGFAVFWEANAIATGAPFFFKLWGVPFVIIGLYIVLGRFFFDARQRTDTHYGVTSERVFVVTSWPCLSVRSLALRTLSEISLREGSQRFGTITFGPLGPFPNGLGNGSWPGMASQSAPSFELLADPKMVYEVIWAAQKEAS